MHNETTITVLDIGICVEDLTVRIFIVDEIINTRDEFVRYLKFVQDYGCNLIEDGGFFNVVH